MQFADALKRVDQRGPVAKNARSVAGANGYAPLGRRPVDVAFAKPPCACTVSGSPGVQMPSARFQTITVEVHGASKQIQNRRFSFCSTVTLVCFRLHSPEDLRTGTPG